MQQAPRHRVFISFYHDDQYYKDWFLQMMGDDIVDESVGDGDIDRGGLVCLNSAARFDKWNRAAVR